MRIRRSNPWSSLRRAWFAVGLCLLAQGCAGDRTSALMSEVEAARRHADYVVREARVEVASLRSEVSATRIAAAKQKAELEELQHQLASLRNERDQLLKTRADLQAQPTDLPSLRQTMTDDRAAQASVQARITELEAVAASLTAELAEMKQHRGQKPPAAPSKSGKPAAGRDTSNTVAPSAVVMTTLAVDRDAGPQGTGLSEEQLFRAGVQDRPDYVRVQPGDSLWAIAKKYRITVADLRTTNELTGDLIRVGQLLIIPPAP